MEPVTHILTGACLARAGCNRRAAYATLAMAVGAEFPDIDTVAGWAGPVTGFAHHRGITHTFAALPVEAALIVAAVCGLHQWRVRRQPPLQPASGRDVVPRPLTRAPVRWTALYGFVLLALLSHLFLDWTNNYGLRPFSPFNPRWYAGSFVFIVDPLLLLFLVVPLVIPRLFALVAAEVGARRAAFRGQGWAIAALLVIAAYEGLRFYQHAAAVQIADGISVNLAPPAPSGVDAGRSADALAPEAPAAQWAGAQRIWVSPDPLSSFRWHVALDFGSIYRLAEIDTRSGVAAVGEQVFAKGLPSSAVETAERTYLGRVYLDWSQMPLVTESSPLADGGRSVLFRDLRFAGDIPVLRNRPSLPITGEVDLNAQGTVTREALDGKSQRIHE